MSCTAAIMAKRNYGNTNSIKKRGGWTSMQSFFPKQAVLVVYQEEEEEEEDSRHKKINKQVMGWPNQKSLSGAARLLGSVSRFLAKQVSFVLSSLVFNSYTHQAFHNRQQQPLSLAPFKSQRRTFLLVNHTHKSRPFSMCMRHAFPPKKVRVGICVAIFVGYQSIH